MRASGGWAAAAGDALSAWTTGISAQNAELKLDRWPVDVRGVASVQKLLCDGCGPLYDAFDGDASARPNALNEALDALEIDL